MSVIFKGGDVDGRPARLDGIVFRNHYVASTTLWEAAVDELERTGGGGATGPLARASAHAAAFAVDCRRSFDPSGQMLKLREFLGAQHARITGDELMAAQIFYPCMQCNDVYMLKCDMTQLGVDQRKVNALAREYCVAKNNINGVFDHLKDDKGVVHKPVVLSHHMLASLKGDNKMSKSDPDAAIFMEDEAKVRLAAVLRRLNPAVARGADFASS